MASEEATPLEEELVRACRTAIGDRLRSITHFTEDDVNQVYLRSDLDEDADLVGFAEAERHGFHVQSLYRASELGSYQYTIRTFEQGYLTRVVNGEDGVFVTTDELSMNRFDELAAAVGSVLENPA
ncbi:MAG: hypothetical protein ABEH77_02595 [Halobacteriaceae archaeon]